MRPKNQAKMREYHKDRSTVSETVTRRRKKRERKRGRAALRRRRAGAQASELGRALFFVRYPGKPLRRLEQEGRGLVGWKSRMKMLISRRTSTKSIIPDPGYITLGVCMGNRCGLEKQPGGYNQGGRRAPAYSPRVPTEDSGFLRLLISLRLFRVTLLGRGSGVWVP